MTTQADRVTSSAGSEVSDQAPIKPSVRFAEMLPRIDAALGTLGDPLRDALGLLTGAEFIDALWSQPNPDRTRFLRDLKLPHARRPPLGAADAALTRLRRWRNPPLDKACRFLSRDVAETIDLRLDDLEDGPVAQLAGDDVFAGLIALLDRAVDDALAGHPSSLVLLHLVSTWDRTPINFAALTRGLRHPELLPATWAERVNQVSRDLDGMLAELPWDEIVAVVRHQEQRKLTQPASADPAPDNRRVRPAPVKQGDRPSGAGPTTVTVSMLEEALEHLKERTTLARAATTRVADALDTGQCPAEQDIDLISEVSAVFQRTIAAAHGLQSQHGIDDAPPLTNLVDLEEAARRLRQQMDPDTALFTRLSGITAPAELSEMVNRLVDLVHEVIQLPVQETVAIRDGLRSLAALADETVRDEADDRLLEELLEAARNLLPEELRPLSLAVLRGKARLPAHSTAVDRSGEYAATTSAVGRTPKETTASTGDEAAPTSHGSPPLTDPPAEQGGLATLTDRSTEPVQRDGPPTGAGQKPVEPSLDDGRAAAASSDTTHTAPVNDGSDAMTGSEEPSTGNGHHQGVPSKAAQAQLPTSVGGTASRLESDWDARIAEVTGQLLVDSHFAAAYWLATASGRPPAHRQALQAAAYAAELRSPHGECTHRLRATLAQLDLRDLHGDQSGQLTVLMAAVRSALLGQDPDAARLIDQLNLMFQACPELVRLTHAVAEKATRGLLSGSEVFAALIDLAAHDTEFAELAEQAHNALERPRTLRLARATDIAADWWAPGGRIGSLLSAVAQDRRGEVATIGAALHELRDRQAISRVVDAADAATRGHGSRRLEGHARRKLIDLVVDSLQPVQRWVALTWQEERRRRTQAGRDWMSAPLAELRDTVRAGEQGAQSELRGLAHNADPELRGAAIAAEGALDELVRILNGHGLPGVEPPADQVLGRWLLKVDRLPLDATLRPLDPHSLNVEALLEAAKADWRAAVERRMAAEDFGTARIALTALAVEQPAHAEQLRQAVDQTEQHTRQELTAWRGEVLDQVRLAARLGQLTDDEATHLLAEATDANPKLRNDDSRTRDDLGMVRATLRRTTTALSECLKRAQTRARAQVAQLVHEGKAGIEQEERVLELIDARDLATAAEFIEELDAGNELPTLRESSDLPDFFPEIPEALADGITSHAVDAAQRGEAFAGLSFAGLSDEQRERTAAALREWATLRSVTRYQESWRRRLEEPLRLAGIECTGERQVSGSARDAHSRERRWVELTGYRRTGRALVPAFGSVCGERLRLLLVWGQPSEETVLAWAVQDLTADPVIVCYFGTLSPDRRRRLAVAAARVAKPLAVLDDAALVYLAARGTGRFSTAMRILLPFSAVNPYDSSTEGNVPVEMFYGRAEERMRIMAAEGTSLIYGGRQLGKSALLHAAERDFKAAGSGTAVYVTCPPGIGSAYPVDALWDSIAERLAEHGIEVPRSRRRRDAAARVEEAVKAWLDANPSQRLLLLLDECDAFFDADAKVDFLHARRFRDLRNHTNRRFKPVFAGLHQVQRFASLPNQPFAHLGRPDPVGPLSSADAYRLIAEPLEALGVVVEPADLVSRVLAYCNNQPILLQLFGEHLVRELHQRRDDLDGPPWIVTEDELEKVWNSEQLQSQVAAKVRLTLDLDPRYRVIACVLGLRALDRPDDPTRPAVELWRESQDWWPDGFATTTTDEFRSLLEEMVGLGMLARAPQAAWRLRTENVRRMLGSRAEIETVLCSAEEMQVPAPLAAAESRRLLTGRRLAPLNERQLADLIGQRSSQLRVVLGTHATGADLVRETLDAVHHELGQRFALIPVNRVGQFRDALRAGEPGQPHRVVFSDISHVRTETCRESLSAARELLPDNPGVTRSVVVLVGQTNLPLWLDLLDPERPIVDPAALVALRRLDRVGVAAWSLGLGGVFGDEESRRRLVEASGGWPLLIDRAAELIAEGRDGRWTLDALRDELASAQLSTRLAQAVGLQEDPELAEAYATLVGLGELAARERAEELAEVVRPVHPRPAAAIAVLTALQALAVEPDSTLTLEPVLARAWTQVQ